MRIHIQRHRNLTMPQNFLYNFGMHFHRKKNSRRAMSQIMKAHMRQTDTDEKPPECFSERTGTVVKALTVGKQQPFINPRFTNLMPLLFLLRTMPSKNI